MQCHRTVLGTGPEHILQQHKTHNALTGPFLRNVKSDSSQCNNIDINYVFIYLLIFSDTVKKVMLQGYFCGHREW